MFALNGTFVIFILLFLVFIQLLNIIMLRPVEIAMERRGKKLKENVDATRACMEENEKVLSHYQAKLHTSREEAQNIIQNALVETQQIKDKQIKDVQVEGRKKLDDMKAELDAGRKSLIDSLIHPELELVKTILSKLLGSETPAPVSEKRVAEVLENTR